jgi:hypothetical protein
MADCPTLTFGLVWPSPHRSKGSAMSSPLSSSRIAIIAGTLAGLLGTALSVYYLRQGAQSPPAPPASQSAAQAPAASARLVPAATPPAAAPAALAERTKEQASRALMALPELKAWSARIGQHSGGKAHGALIEYDPAPRKVGGKRYWQLSFVENSLEAAELWESFLASMTDDEILVEDSVSGELLSLERWRAQSHPMQRSN